MTHALSRPQALLEAILGCVSALPLASLGLPVSVSPSVKWPHCTRASGVWGVQIAASLEAPA